MPSALPPRRPSALAPERSPQRDRALDVARGVAITVMIIGHVGPSSWIITLAHLPVWFTIDAPFVLLSGAVLGMRARHRLSSNQRDVEYRSLRSRAWELLGIHYVSVLAVGLLAAVGVTLTLPTLAQLGGPLKAAWFVATLQFQPVDYLNILPLYVIFLLAAPAVLEAARRGWAGPVLLVSGLLWAVAQAHPTLVPLPNPRFGVVAFSLAAWQWLFVLGLLFGYFRTSVFEPFWRRRRSWLLPATAGLVLVLFLAAQTQRSRLAGLGLKLPASWEWLVSKQTWGPLRAVYTLGILVLGVIAIGALQRRWSSSGARRPDGALQRVGARGLLAAELLGRQSLRCFILHLPLALAATAVALHRGPWWVLEGAVVLSVVLVYQLARSDVVARFVPN